MNNMKNHKDQRLEELFENTKFFAPRLTSIKIGFPQMPLDRADNARQLTSKQGLRINKYFYISLVQIMILTFYVGAMSVNLVINPETEPTLLG